MRQVDWRTIGFIIGLFLVVSGLEQTGILDGLARFLGNLGGEDTGRMMVGLIWFTALPSAFVDNIPMATVMVPVLTALSDGLGMDLETLTWSVSKGTDIGGGIATPSGPRPTSPASCWPPERGTPSPGGGTVSMLCRCPCWCWC